MLVPWKKSYDKPRQCIKKQRHHFANKSLYGQSYVFFSSQIWMWELNHKEHRRIDAFELWCWIKFLRVPWTVRRSNQWILKQISPGYSLERLMLRLKLQCFGYLMQRTDSLEMTLMLGKIESRRRGDDRGWDGWMALLSRWRWVWASSRSWWWTGKTGLLQSMGSQRVRHDWASELNWTDPI